MKKEGATETQMKREGKRLLSPENWKCPRLEFYGFFFPGVQMKMEFSFSFLDDYGFAHRCFNDC